MEDTNLVEQHDRDATTLALDELRAKYPIYGNTETALRRVVKEDDEVLVKNDRGSTHLTALTVQLD